MCCILEENRISIQTESCLGIHPYDRIYSFRRLLIKPKGCLQDDSFQRFHDPFLKKMGVISAFFKFYGKYYINNELLELL